ncbi:uncharacterized protein B0H64DRAFT_351081 [Chaetomium fimeti]|uniref:DOMON domain-containing protein n=1 Tax=Chaetomium fimeti TaxID=1854472 RepID=A0AAE0HNJ8_9PEZI|nr:hypothetical protein B0H64DRAFT_351081 [Chaetomium fimeti]
MRVFSNTSSLLSLLLLLGGSQEGEASPALEKRQTTGQYCDTASGMCYLEYSWGPTAPVFRVAVPDTAATDTDFDTLLQIVSPASFGWVGFGWGGRMTLNPLTVVWPNGQSATVSSRWSSGRTLPQLYPEATYRTVGASRNSTHWTVETVCSGCSKWSGGRLSTTGVNSFAWAVSETTVAQPANTASSFQVHDNIGMFSESLEPGTVPAAQFEEHVGGAN